MQDPKVKKVDSWDEDVVDAKPVQVDDWGEDVSDTPVQKKSEVGNESTKPLQPRTEPSATPTEAVKGVGTTAEFGEPATELKPVEITPKEETPTFTESVKGSYDNFINQLKSFVPNTQIAAASVWEGVLGKELANKWYNLEGRDIDEVRSNAYAKLDELQKEYQPTRGLIESAKSLDAAGFSAALIDAVSAIGSTAITSGATLGGGLITDMVGRSIADYNTEKAKTKGKSVDDLYKEGEADVLFPTIVGLVGAGLEGVGLKGTQQAIISKITPLAAKQFAKFGWEANKEGLTEYTQTILEEVNKGVAQGKSGEEVAQIALNTAMSEQAAEAYLKGVAGSAGVAIGAKVAKGGYKSLTKEESQNLNDAIKTDKGVSIASAVNKAVNSGVMDAAQGMEIVSALKPRIETVNNLPAAVADNQQAVEAVTEIKQLESKKQGLNEIESAFVDAQINDLQKTVAIPLPSKYVNSAGMNTSELKDGQLYIQKDGSVKSWDATNEKFLDKSPLIPKSQKPKANVTEVLNQIYELEQSKRFENEEGKKKIDEEIERLKQSIRGTSEEGGKQVTEAQPAKVQVGTEVELEPTVTQEPKVLDEPKAEVKEVEKAEVSTAEAVADTVAEQKDVVSPKLLKEDYDLSKDTEADFVYDIQDAIGFPIGNNNYARFGDNLVRIKNHTPDWANFTEDIEDFGVKRIVNVTVGDFDNSDYRRSKRTLDDMKLKYPDVEFVDIKIGEGESVNDAIKKVYELLGKKVEPVKTGSTEAVSDGGVLETQGQEVNATENVSLTNEGNKSESVENKGVEATENPALQSIDATAKALEGTGETIKPNQILTEQEYFDIAKQYELDNAEPNKKEDIEKKYKELAKRFKRDKKLPYPLDYGYNNGWIGGEMKQYISEAYHKAKSDGSNPELVKAVEGLLGKKAEVGEVAPEAKAELPSELQSVEATAKALEGVDKKLTNTPSLKDARIVLLEDANLSATEETKSIEVINENNQNNSWNKALRKGAENLGNGWFRVGKTMQGESILYSPQKNEAIVLKGAKVDGIAVQDFVKNNFGNPKETAEAYHKAKADGSNPELVKAVEDLIGKQEKPTTVQVEDVANKSGISPNNLKDLYSVNRNLFGQNRVKALASAIAMDRMVGVMAKRAGITKAKMYGRLKFEKANDEFVKGLSEKGKVLFQLVGENAQLAQDVRDNLQVARDMETAGKDAKTIRMATGWEKGKDGKWRYETRDLQLESGKSRTTDIVGSTINNEELLELYPQLSGVGVIIRIDEKNDNIGSYTPYVDRSSEGLFDLQPEIIVEAKTKKDAESILAHEIQHAIQDIEGFAKGGNVDMFSKDKFDSLTKEKQRLEHTKRGLINEKNSGYKDFGKAHVDAELEKVNKRLKELESLNIYDQPYEQYRKLAGEVEARNVQTRMGMTHEQRRATTLQETEDVARDEQIVLFQKSDGKSQGAVMVGMDGQAVIYAITDPNVSTPLHELAHVFEHYLTDTERKTVMESAGTKEWSTQTSEKFARGFERYLANGNAPTPALQKIFDKFKQWLIEIYNGITGSEIDIELNDAMREVYSQMLGSDVVNKKATVQETRTEEKGKQQKTQQTSLNAENQQNKVGVEGLNDKETPAQEPAPAPSITEAEAKTLKQEQINEVQDDEIKRALMDEDARIRRAAEKIQQADELKGEFIDNVSDYKESVIADNMGRITEQSFQDFSDQNLVTEEIRKAYFPKPNAKVQTTIDQLAKEMSDLVGLEITTGDIAAFINKYPDGVGSRRSKKEGTFYAENNPRDKRAELLADAEVILGYPLDKEGMERFNNEVEKLKNDLAEINAREISEADIEALNQEYEDYLNTLTDEQRQAELAKQRIEGEQIMEGAEDANRKAIQERDARQQEAERTAERAKRELTPIQEAMARLKKAKKERDSAYDAGRLGTALDPFEQAKKRAEADKELFDAYVGLAKEYIKQGVLDVKAFAKEIGEDVTDIIKGAWETAKGDVEKTLVTERAYMGKFREDVKRELEKIGLTREVGSQKEAENKAREVIDAVGIGAALDAVRSGDITNGDVEAAIYFLSIEDLGKQIDQSQDEVNIASLVSMQAALLNELGEQQTRAGQFSAIAQRFYTNSDLGYKAEVKAREWKNEFGAEPSEELMQKWRERDKEFAELNKKLKEAEAKAKEAEEKAAMSNIKQSVDNEVVMEKKKAQPKIYGKTRIAKGLDDLASALGAKLSAVGDERAKVTKALKDIGLGLIEEGVATTKNVAQKIREYLDANFKGKIDFDQYETDVVSEITGISTEDGLKVPHSLIRQFVKDGIDNIDDLTKAVHEVVSQADPSITERQVRDAITGYGNVVMPNKDEIERSIRKMKRVGRIVSALEDIKKKKRPLKSGKQRDALEADERRLLGELREAMKELPADDETKANELRTRLDATKRRLENQIDDLEYEIETKEALPKSDKTTVEDDEVRQLKAKRDALKKERDLIIRDAEVVEAKRLEMAKKRAKQRIDDYERRLREGDFSKKVAKPVIADTELVKLNAEKLRLKEEYDKEFYKEKLRKRTDAEKRKDIAWEAWNIPRVLMATGEWSFIGIQGIKQSIAHPTYAVKAFKNALMAMSSEKKTEAWLREIKSQEWYPIMKESKLALTEPNAELTAREELFYSGWTNFIWDNLGNAILSPTRFGGKEAYEKAVKAWSNANPIKATERASVGYLDTLRVMRFLDAMQILEEKGMTFQENKQDYKDAADVINTLTGRASLGKLEQNAQLLSKLFFSPRNWASAFKTATPYALVYFSKMTPTARKMALADMSKFLGLTTSMVALAALSLNNDDDDETSVELDPRSTDFAKIKIGNTRIDPWGGMQQQIVLGARLISDVIMKGFALAGKESPIEGAYKKGDEVLPLGVPYKTPSEFDLIVKQAANKLNPTASILYNFSKTKLGKEGKLVNEYGQEYTLSEQFSDKFYPIFWGTANELLKDDPTALDGLLTFYAFFGGGVQIYETKQSKSTPSQSAKPLQPAKPIKPLKPLKP